jgi:hypothetical protein
MAITGETIGFELTKAAVSGMVKPALSAAFSGLKSLSNAVVNSFGDRFSEYVSQQANRHSKLSTIVFGHQKSLDELYIPLTVVESGSASRSGRPNEIRIDRFKTELLPQETRVLITDTAGMGKSTLSKFLFLQCLKSLYAIPIFIELRQLSEKNTVSTVIQKQLNTVAVAETEPKFTKKQVERLFAKGGMVFFLDGYDEIPFKDREAVTKDIKGFIEKYDANIYIITSRPETGLLAFPTFKQFSIRPLKKEESFALIRKYDQNGGRSEQLIKKLEGREFHAVQQFLGNPLLASLLYRSFEYKQNVPLKKHIFYRQVYDALFDWHDATKDGYNTREKKSGLDIDAFHRVLRVIGFVSVMRGEVEGDTDAVLGWIRKARDICSTTPFSESYFLDDLVRSVPIFVKDGDLYRWSHKSLAEYFAAQYLCTEGKPQQSQVLTALLESGRTARFSNVLDQMYDIDTTGFRTHLILPMAKAFASYWSAAYRGLDASISVTDLVTRKELLFDRAIVMLPLELLQIKAGDNDLSGLIRKALGRTISLDESNFEMYLYDSPQEQVMAIITGPFSTIVEILAGKKDPLVRRFAHSADFGRSYRYNSGKQPHLVTDSPTEVYNRPAHFAKFTASLMRPPMTVWLDSERVLSFESTFQDVDRLSELADELIRPMLPLPTPPDTEKGK